MTPNPLPTLRRAGLALLLAAGAAAGLAIGNDAHAAVGTATLPPAAGNGPVTVFYPTDATPQTLHFGAGVSASVAPEAPVVAGNRRLVIVSHGSGGGPWVHGELIAELVGAGFVVGVPEHRGDNRNDPSEPGPASFARRPAEVSQAIDAVLGDARFAPLLDGRRVGLFGMSAGGHTALSLAGGRWSPAGLRDHCEAHMAEDFAFCSGLNLRLTGGPLDGFKQWLVRQVIRWRFDDATPHEDHDARIAAIVAAVPAAADFDMASLAEPRVPLALATAAQDRWLVPRFHSDRVLAACRSCVQLVDLPAGGHGAYLGPLPRLPEGSPVADLLNDPPGFDRATLGSVNRQIAGWLQRELERPAEATTAPLP